ncbi:GNAT family N-acetyltransferase [Paenibacillus sp. NPDC058174]|uniref:GNAT family N-acetyltransferase n=1 Tax=Paenibacillus sp. NPDC058174 TaxID=3346366 RepID=UPI0036DA3BFB
MKHDAQRKGGHFIQISKAVLADAAAIARVHVDSWKTTYANIIPDEYLKAQSYEQRERLWMEVIPKNIVFVAANEEGSIVGFADGGSERSGNYPQFDGQLNAIYVLQAYQGQGLGKRLVQSVVHELKQNGMKSMLVHVLEANPSRTFYEGLGGKLVDSFEVDFAGEKLTELVLGWDINGF